MISKGCLVTFKKSHRLGNTWGRRDYLVISEVYKGAFGVPSVDIMLADGTPWQMSVDALEVISK